MIRSRDLERPTETQSVPALRSLPLVRWTAILLLLSYCFPWLRIPDFFGVPLTLQRVLGWTSFGLIVGLAVTRGRLPFNFYSRLLLGAAALFLIHVGISGGLRWQTWAPYSSLHAVIESSKLVAGWAAAYLIYYSLHRRILRLARFDTLLVGSGAVCIVVTYGLLLLFWLGFRTDQEIIANAFGSSLGVWPTSGLFPRLAGPTAEPQQLSVVFLTPLMLMATRVRLRRWWWVVILGLLALILSQSKFAVVSLTLVFAFAFLAFRGQRILLISIALVLIPVLALLLANLPTFTSIFRQGLQAQAFTERFDNNVLLLEAFGMNPVFGIGLGQYGTYRGEIVFGDPDLDRGYFPNNDYLSILAETGLLGFALVMGPVLILLGRFTLSIPRRSGPERSRYLALLLGAYGIALNMLIGYELMHVFFWINIGALLYLYRRPEAGEP